MNYNLIKIKRLEQNLSQSQVAKMSNTTQSFISKLENGKVLGTIPTISKIAHVLHIHLSDLFYVNTESQNEIDYMFTLYKTRQFNTLLEYIHKTQKNLLMSNEILLLFEAATQSALCNFNVALDICSRIVSNSFEQTKWKVLLYIVMGESFYGIQKYKLSLNFLRKAEHIIQNFYFPELVKKLYRQLGVTLAKLNDNKNAVRYLKLSHSIVLDDIHYNIYEYIDNLYHLAIILQNQNNIPSALHYAQEAYKFAEFVNFDSQKISNLIVRLNNNTV